MNQELIKYIEYCNTQYKKIKIDYNDNINTIKLEYTNNYTTFEMFDTCYIHKDFEITKLFFQGYEEYFNKKCKQVYKKLLKLKTTNNKFIKTNLKEICYLLKIIYRFTIDIENIDIERAKEDIRIKLENLDTINEKQYIEECDKLKKEFETITRYRHENRNLVYLRYLENESLIITCFSFYHLD